MKNITKPLCLVVLISLYACHPQVEEEFQGKVETKIEKKVNKNISKEIPKDAYLKNRKKLFKTKLLKKGRAPYPYNPLPVLYNTYKTIKLIHYDSEVGKCKALLDTTNVEHGKKKPAVVYLDGGFAIGYISMQVCQPFIDAGYIVLIPSYRGENGNPGYFELFAGEVDDTKEAICWLAKQPYVDEERIFTFGHSVGGGMSLLLSLHPDIPIKKSGSSAGLYTTSILDRWESGYDIVPFNSRDKTETIFRFPLYTLKYMFRKHQMYIGLEDDFEKTKKILKNLYPDTELKLELIEVEGNHFTSLSQAMKLFIEEIKEEN